MKSITLTMALACFAAGVVPAEAANPEIKCQQQKLKAQGKRKTCLVKSAAGVLGGKADVSAECETKFEAALAKADEKAAAQGAACRFIDNGDGTVSDLDNGLMWEKKTDNNTVHDVDNGYTWTVGSPYGPTGTAFTSFLAALNGGSSTDGLSTNGCFADHCDWRLPTVGEMQTILVLPCSLGPCIDTVFGPTRSDVYWTMSTVGGATDQAWVGSFSTGGVGASINKASGIYVRAVRGGL